MQVFSHWSRSLAAAMCLCGTFAVAQEAPQKPANDTPPPPVDVRKPIDEPKPSAGVVDSEGNIAVISIRENPNASGLFVLEVGAAQAEAGKYWIGLLCVDAGEVLREQLGLEAGVGLLVEAVTDEAPAKKAGVLKNDLLLTVTIPSDDPNAEPKSLTQVMQLVEAVQKSETKPLKFVLLRRGQKQNIEVTPAERPQVQFLSTSIAVQLDEAAQQQLLAQRKLAEARAEQAAQAAAQARLALQAFDQKLQGPQQLGMRMAGSIHTRTRRIPKLPEGLSMEFRQVVGQPEHILVSKGDQKWDVTAEELGKLPADVRGQVEQQLAIRRDAAGPLSAYYAKQPAMVAYPPDWSQIVTTGPQPFIVKSYGQAEPQFQSAIASKSVHNFADELVVTIGRKGSEPAQINVKKKDQSWDITEKELDKLPEDVRKQVAPLLAPPSGATSFSAGSGMGTWTTKVQAPYTTYVPNEYYQRSLQQVIRSENGVPQKSAGQPGSASQLQERQEAMLKQLQQLTEKVEKLQQTLEKSATK